MLIHERFGFLVLLCLYIIDSLVEVMLGDTGLHPRPATVSQMIKPKAFCYYSTTLIVIQQMYHVYRNSLLNDTLSSGVTLKSFKSMPDHGHFCKSPTTPINNLIIVTQHSCWGPYMLIV